MIIINVIGHLGADAVCQTANGNEFTTFRVAHSEKFKDDSGQVQEVTTWVDCVMNGHPNVLPYLRKGTQVYCSGSATLRVFDSKKYHCKMAGLQCRVRDLQLLSTNKEQTNTSDNGNEPDNSTATTGNAPF